ncbi:cardiolipin synthase B [Undibacterium piscinae]|jgi:cardiolipin synthase|uniref:Cardiolipin synthase B n=1 Tax=Undibacterium piscinae TaxID=2495591 RepID=A0A6M4A6Z6_9BURK|nr:cardiolipin synthase B [Undibacterium piscinae]
MRKLNFISGNEVRLLHCGSDYFVSLLQEILQARTEIYLETYIFSDDAISLQVQGALIAAAARGVQVRIIIDWVGTGEQRSQQLLREFALAGVACRCFNPWFKRGLSRTHRKIAVFDRRVALVGGLNIIDDLISDDGSGLVLAFPRWDFAVSVKGGLLSSIHLEVEAQWLRLGKLNLISRVQLIRDLRQELRIGSNQPMQAALVVRDNLRNRSTIQRAYLQALGMARKRAILANPYFAPGRKLRNALISAASRGVDVTLLIGVGQFKLQDAVTHSFYPKLLLHGVKIIEYRRTQLHAKVAVIDDEWATVGSSNFDGLSLFVNQEANIVIRDQDFARNLTVHLEQGIADGVAVAAEDYANHPWYRRFWYGTAYLLYRGLMRIATLGSYT